MIGAPSGAAIHPGSILAPTRFARVALLPAIWVVPISNRNGGMSPAGAAHAIGFVPSIGRAPNVGSILTPPLVDIARPIMSASAAIMAW